MTSLVITGGRGFLGRRVAARLTRPDIALTIVSRRELPGIVHVLDYRDTPSADIMVHLAENADRAAVNREGPAAIDRARAVADVLAGRCGRLIYASSGVVYGDRDAIPKREDAPVFGDDIYCRSKLAVEDVVLARGGAALRLANLIGPGMPDNTVLSDIVRQVPGSGPLNVRDDEPVRDFLDVDDAAAAVARLIDVHHGGILNIGSGTGTSIRALAALALAAAGEQGRSVVATAPARRQSVTILDRSLATSVLGWQPSRTLDQSVAALLRAVNR